MDLQAEPPIELGAVLTCLTSQSLPFEPLCVKVQADNEKKSWVIVHLREHGWSIDRSLPVTTLSLNSIWPIKTLCEIISRQSAAFSISSQTDNVLCEILKNRTSNHWHTECSNGQCAQSIVSKMATLNEKAYVFNLTH